MEQKISISDFNFTFLGYGCYEVIYTSPRTGKTWRTQTTDMSLIDATKNEEFPKVKDLKLLKQRCKRG